MITSFTALSPIHVSILFLILIYVCIVSSLPSSNKQDIVDTVVCRIFIVGLAAATVVIVVVYSVNVSKNETTTTTVNNIISDFVYYIRAEE